MNESEIEKDRMANADPMLDCVKPAQVSQPYAYECGNASKSELYYASWFNFRELPEGAKPLFLAPPDYEALLAKVVMLENNSKADDRLINSADSLVQSMRLEAETLKSRVAEWQRMYETNRETIEGLQAGLMSIEKKLQLGYTAIDISLFVGEILEKAK